MLIQCNAPGYSKIEKKQHFHKRNVTLTAVQLDIFHLLFTSWPPIMVFYAADAFGVPSQCHRMCNLIYASVLSAIGYQPLYEAHLAHFLCLTDTIASVHRHGVVGGHKTRIIRYKDISAFIKSGALHKCSDIQSKEFCFIDYIDPTTTNEYSADSYLHLKFPMDKLVHFIPPAQAHQLAKMHGVETGPRTSIAQLRLLFEDHGACNICTTHITIVSMQSSQKEHISTQRKKMIGNKTVEEKLLMHVQAQKRLTKHQAETHKSDFVISDFASVFPPPPLNKDLSHKIISAACLKLKSESFEEMGCAVCGQLVLLSSLSRLSAVKMYLNILDAPGFTRQERHKVSDKIVGKAAAQDNGLSE
jgi:hypothetical protein